VADPGLPGRAPKLCWFGTPMAAGFVMPIAPALTGGVPRVWGSMGRSRAPELVVGGSELSTGGAGKMMLRLLLMAPWPIGLAAHAVLAPMSKAMAANIGNADFMRLISLSKNCAVLSKNCAVSCANLRALTLQGLLVLALLELVLRKMLL
jgi:hypothetical protein